MSYIPKITTQAAHQLIAQNATRLATILRSEVTVFSAADPDDALAFVAKSGSFTKLTPEESFAVKLAEAVSRMQSLLAAPQLDEKAFDALSEKVGLEVLRYGLLRDVRRWEALIKLREIVKENETQGVAAKEYMMPNGTKLGLIRGGKDEQAAAPPQMPPPPAETPDVTQASIEPPVEAEAPGPEQEKNRIQQMLDAIFGTSTVSEG